VQAAINTAFTLLPSDLPTPPVYSKVNPADTPILTLGLTSTTLPLPQVEDLADTRLAQKIAQLPGVGLVSFSGGQRPAVRVQANPTALAAYGQTLEDLRTAVSAANVNQAKGSFDGPQQSSVIGANDQLLTSRDYRPLIIAYRNNAPVTLSDVADAIDEAENVRRAAWMNAVPAVILNIQRQPGANVITVVDRIKQLLPQLQASLPSSVQVAERDRADRHRQEERHHDDRLCTGGGASGRQAPRRRHLPGLPAALPADHDDHDGGAAGGAAAGTGDGGGVGAAAAARHRHRRRAARQPDAHPLHDPGGISLSRPRSASVRTHAERTCAADNPGRGSGPKGSMMFQADGDAAWHSLSIA